MEQIGRGTFAPWNFRSQDYSLPGTFGDCPASTYEIDVRELLRLHCVGILLAVMY